MVSNKKNKPHDFMLEKLMTCINLSGITARCTVHWGGGADILTMPLDYKMVRYTDLLVFCLPTV